MLTSSGKWQFTKDGSSKVGLTIISLQDQRPDFLSGMTWVTIRTFCRTWGHVWRTSPQEEPGWGTASLLLSPHNNLRISQILISFLHLQPLHPLSFFIPCLRDIPTSSSVPSIFFHRFLHFTNFFSIPIIFLLIPPNPLFPHLTPFPQFSSILPVSPSPPRFWEWEGPVVESPKRKRVVCRSRGEPTHAQILITPHYEVKYNTNDISVYPFSATRWRKLGLVYHMCYTCRRGLGTLQEYKR